MRLTRLVFPLIAVFCAALVFNAVFFDGHDSNYPGSTFGEIVYDPSMTLDDLALPEGWAWDDGTICPTVNGTYRVTYTSPNKSAPYSKLITLNIAPKPLSEPTADTTTFLFDLSEKTLGLTGFDALTMTVSGNAMTDMGDHTAVIRLIDNVNYRWASGVPEVTIAWSIVNGDADDAADYTEPAIGNMTYDPVRALADLTLPTGWAWLDDTVCPTANAAGYWAVFTSADPAYTPFYKLIVLAVDPVIVTEPTVTQTIFFYDGSEKILALTGFDGSIMTVSDDAMTDIGDYTAVIRLNDNVNYEWASGVPEVTIEWAIVEKLPDVFNASPRLTGGILYFDAVPGAAEYEITVNGTAVGRTTVNRFDLSAVESLKSVLPWIKPDTDIAYIIKIKALARGDQSLEVANFTHKSEIGVTEISSTLHRWKLGNTARFNEIYDIARQQTVRSEIDDLISKYEYTPQNPLVIKNPFGTNELGLYVYFETEADCRITYTVKALGTPAIGDFTRTANSGNYGTVHEFQVMGIVHQRLCEIYLTLETVDGDRTTIAAFRVNGQCSTTPPNLSIEEKNDPDNKITEGLFAVFEDYTFRYNFHLFDNDGIRRGYITCGYGYTRILFDDDGNWIYDGTKEKVVVVSPLGEVIRIYATPGYTNHHDIIFGTNNDILKLAENTSIGRREDFLLSINRDTGSFTVIDLRDFFPSYDYTRNGNDWLHANSMSIVPESNGTCSLMISSRELSAVFMIKDLYGTPAIDWILTDNILNMTPYGRILTKTVGGVPGGIPNLGQHTITYIKHDETDPNKYYVHLFNNMYQYSSQSDFVTGNIYDFTNLDPAAVAAIKTRSSMDIYLIDEAAGTCELIQTINVPYARFMSSSQIYMGNYIIGSAYGPYIYECDSDGNVLVKFKFGGTLANGSFYRVFKYDI